MDRDPLTEKVIGCAIEVHRILGPGLLESAYDRRLGERAADPGAEGGRNDLGKLSGISTGLFLNFNVQLLKDGITRFKL